MRIWNAASNSAALRFPLVGAGRALGEFPLEAEKVFQEVVAPLGGRGGPGDFQTAGDGVGAFAGAITVLPAKALVLKAGRFWLRRNVSRWGSAVGLAKGVTARDERDRFLIVHRHAAESFA